MVRGEAHTLEAFVLEELGAEKSAKDLEAGVRALRRRAEAEGRRAAGF